MQRLIISAVRRVAMLALLLPLLLGGGGCGSTAFAVADASVDPSHTCPAGSKNTAYDLNATANADNPTSGSVQIRSAAAELTVAAIHGLWQEPVGYRYDAASLVFTPASVGANSKSTVKVTIPSACSNSAHTGAADNYADYSVVLTLVTSAGTFKLSSRNTHRIVAP